MSKRVMIIGSKETFLIRAIEKKLEGAGLEYRFVNWDIDEINVNWEGTTLVTMHMDERDVPPVESLHFLKDKLSDEEKLMVIIGGRNENEFVRKHIPKDLIYEEFLRPIDNEKYVKDVTKLFKNVEEGSFKKTILVVDDDAAYLNLVRGWLKDTYKVAMANSGLQAITWLARNKADLILLDQEMPVTSGPQVLEMLRNDSETQSIPVMFLTGKGDKKSVMEVMSLKPQGYFLKSIEREKLLEELKNFFASQIVKQL